MPGARDELFESSNRTTVEPGIIEALDQLRAYGEQVKLLCQHLVSPTIKRQAVQSQSEPGTTFSQGPPSDAIFVQDPKAPPAPPW